MKKIALFLAIAMCVSLVGCNGDKKTNDVSSINSSVAESSDVVSKEETSSQQTDSSDTVKSASLDVEITFPAELYEGSTEEEIISENTDDYIAALNEDGTVTVKMTSDRHNKIMEECKVEAAVAYQEMVDDDETYPSIKSITPNDDFTEITIAVDKAIYENSTDAIAVLTIGATTMLYQLFDNVPQENIKTTVNVVDETTKETITSFVYPDILSESEK